MDVYVTFPVICGKKHPQQGHPFTKIAKIKTTKIPTDLGCQIKNTRELLISRSTHSLIKVSDELKPIVYIKWY